jgi:peptidoglycan/LPS O-acetylase OafA/YrhL
MINNFGNLVILFMIISAFSMCCGYYEKIINNEISLTEFYKKRYCKILPFFGFLVILDLLLSHDMDSLWEAFADLTLCFSLLPNPDIEVIGVGWFLGVVFLFYMLFPFFCFLLRSKKTAWFSFGVSVIWQFACDEYFLDKVHVGENFAGHNFLSYAMYFMAGGILYLYRAHLITIARKIKWILLAVIGFLMVIYLQNLDLQVGYYNSFVLLLLFSLWLWYAVGAGGRILDNKVTRFVSGISMEIYLSHMLVFRVFERLNLLYVFGKGQFAYCMLCVVVILCAVFFACAFQFVEGLLKQCIILDI